MYKRHLSTVLPKRHCSALDSRFDALNSAAFWPLFKRVMTHVAQTLATIT